MLQPPYKIACILRKNGEKVGVGREREVRMVCVMPRGVWNWLQFDNVASAVGAAV